MLPERGPWSDGASYERYMGRWSRRVAREFIAWLGQPAGLSWLDVGCGTGALTATICAECAPGAIVAVDPSGPFIDYARGTLRDNRVRFEVASASALPVGDRSIDVVASGLALNFFADRPAAFAEMQRVAKPNATIAFYVWDYPGGGMGFMDAFWEAAMAVARADERLDEELEACGDDVDCRHAAIEKHAAAMREIQATRDARVDAFLEESR